MSARYRNHIRVPGKLWFDHHQANINYDSENELFEFNIRGENILNISYSSSATAFDTNVDGINDNPNVAVGIGQTDSLNTKRISLATDSPYINNFENMYNKTDRNDAEIITISGYLNDFSGEGYRQMTPGAIADQFNNAITNINLETDGPTAIESLEISCDNASRTTETIKIVVTDQEGNPYRSDEITLNGQNSVLVTWFDDIPLGIFRIKQMYVYSHSGQQVSEAKPQPGIVYLHTTGASTTAGVPDNDSDKWASLDLEETISTSGYFHVPPNQKFYAISLTICKDGDATTSVKVGIQYRPCNRDYGTNPQNKQWWITYGNYAVNTTTTIPLHEFIIDAGATGADIRLIAGEGTNSGSQGGVTVKLDGFFGPIATPQQ